MVILGTSWEKTLGIWRKYGKCIENSLALIENKMGTHWEHQNLKGGMESLFKNKSTHKRNEPMML
jgi:hypothetical protein